MPYYCQLHTAGMGVWVSASVIHSDVSPYRRGQLFLPLSCRVQPPSSGTLSFLTGQRGARAFFQLFFSIPGQQQSAGHGCGFNIVLMGGQRTLVTKPQVTESGVLIHLCRRSLRNTCDRDECLHCLRSVFETIVCEGFWKHNWQM